MTPFYLVDVFTTDPFTGNPLAVVSDADGLSTERMQRIAGEFNQNETTFVLAPTLPDADWRLRSFTAVGTEVFGVGGRAGPGSLLRPERRDRRGAGRQAAPRDRSPPTSSPGSWRRSGVR